MEAGSAAVPDGGRIPLSAFHYLRSAHNLDLSHHRYSFSHRGAQFYKDVSRAEALAAREAQMDE
eukprot:3956967-Pyramimonas_sp.AAC.1